MWRDETVGDWGGAIPQSPSGRRSPNLYLLTFFHQSASNSVVRLVEERAMWHFLRDLDSRFGYEYAHGWFQRKGIMGQSWTPRRDVYWGNFPENLNLGPLKRGIWCIFCVQYHIDFYISNFLYTWRSPYIFFALCLQISPKKNLLFSRLKINKFSVYFFNVIWEKFFSWKHSFIDSIIPKI